MSEEKRFGNPTNSSSQWNRVRCVNVVVGKRLKNNVRSIVQRMAEEQSSSTESEVSKQNPSSRSMNSLASQGKLLSGYSRSIVDGESDPLDRSFGSWGISPATKSSDDDDDDDLLYGHQYAKKLRISGAMNSRSHFDTNDDDDDDDDSYTDYTDYRSYESEPFFPERTRSDYSQSQEERRTMRRVDASDEPARYHWFKHPFHWSQDIEHGSPWVTHRSREIFNHVGGWFESRKREMAENDSEKNAPVSKPEAVRENDGEAAAAADVVDDDDDDSFMYKVANKMCDALLMDEKNNRVTSEDRRQCASTEDYKWTRLYENLVNYGQL